MGRQVMSKLITREYKGLTFTFREDGYFNMTKAAKAFGKDMQVFSRRDDTVEYIDALAKTVPDTELVEAKAGCVFRPTVTGCFGRS